ncbi:MAG: T9SS type A sorting domain-containing protein [Bacteroidales bacterium]|nr:T9SS type A sorting domain-containing protein [Bacteroidales bacterium]
MKNRLLLILFILVSFSFGAFAQGITNNGAVIVIESGTTVSVTNGGGYYNLTNGTAHGQIDLDGTLDIEGDFENNVTDVTENVFINVNTDGTVVFTGTADQSISNSTANAYIDFENVTVDKTSNTVFLDAGSAATVNGVLNVNAGTFRLSSPADGEAPSGSLITNTGAAGNVTGAGALWVDRHFETNGRWVYFSVPVSNGSDDDFDNTNNSHPFNANLYTYDESYNAPGTPPNTNYTNWTEPAYAFYNSWYNNQIADEFSDVTMDGGDALGYATYNELEIDVEFGGSPSSLNNAASYGPAVSYTFNDGNSGYYDGWNFVGNPYPVALDWDNINWTKTGISNTVYMWDGDNGNYVYYNDGSPDDHENSPGSSLNGDARYIPAMQGFFVKASAAPTLTIPDDARLHYQKDMYKNGSGETTEFEYIMLRTEHEGFSDETIVRFFEDATTAVDDAFDAYKMFPWSTPAMIYSLALNPIEIPVAINSLPVSTIGTTVPLGFLTEEAGSYSISVNEYNFELSTEVKLIDTYLETETLLDEGIEYFFTFDGGENRDRFFLFVAPEAVDIEDPQEEFETNVNVWSNGNNVHITISSYELIDARVEIFDVLGKSVIQKRLIGTYNVVNVPGSSGTYFVKLRTKDGTVRTDKVFIQK